MIRLSPNILLIGIGLSVFLMFMTIILRAGEFIPEIPSLAYKIYFCLLGLLFFWWPFDLLIHWDKRTAASFEKDKYIAMTAGFIILFVFPYYWFATPLWPTMGFSFLLCVVIPMIVFKVKRKQEKKITIDPQRILQIGMRSPRASEFLRYFPTAHCYVYGLSQMDGDRAHVILQHRIPYTEIEGAQIDYVLDIGVDRRLGIYIGGKEQLQCYFFVNMEQGARIGFLPSANIGRALDYGFSEAEIERAIQEAESSEQRWGKLGDQPLIVQHYPGKIITIR